MKIVLSTLLENITIFKEKNMSIEKLETKEFIFCIGMNEAQNIHKYSTWVPWTNLKGKKEELFHVNIGHMIIAKEYVFKVLTVWMVFKHEPFTIVFRTCVKINEDLIA